MKKLVLNEDIIPLRAHETSGKKAFLDLRATLRSQQCYSISTTRLNEITLSILLKNYVTYCTQNVSKTSRKEEAAQIVSLRVNTVRKFRPVTDTLVIKDTIPFCILKI